MEKERNNILEDFRYGFCNLLGESSNTIDLESQLGWNEEAISLLTEIYPIVGKMNLDLAKDRKSTITIDEYDLIHDKLFNDSEDSKWHKKCGKYFCDSRNDNRLGEVRLVKALADLSDYNDIVVGLRNLLYSEIEVSNYRILDEEYDENVSAILFEMGVQLTNFFEESFEESKFEGGSRLRINISSLRVRELVDFIENRIDRIESLATPNRLVLIIECLEVIKNSGLVANADRLWNIFLLKLYSVALFGNELGEFQEIDKYFSGDRYESIIKNSYRKIDDSLQMLQRGNIQNMLSLYSVNHLSSRAFYNHDVIRELYSALNSSRDLRERYLINIKNNRGNPTGKNHPKCFAAMYNRDTKKKYAAISGVFDADRYIYPGVTTAKSKNKSLERKKEYNNLVLILKNILGNSYEIIDSDDDVKYYYKKSGKMKRVTAKRYISSPYPVDKRPGNRMFSCCERKLSTKLVPGCEHDFYVKYAPCTLCDRMIAEETKNNAHFINIFWVGKIKDKTKDKLAEYDKSADAAN